MERDLKHLEHIEEVKYNWYDNMLRNGLPKRFFSNHITGNFLIACEKILSNCFKQTENIMNRFKID